MALTVKNYDAWCSVTVNGGTASSAASQTVCVAAGGSVPVSAVALSGFTLGAKPWHDTSGDTGSGDPGTVTGSGQTASDATTVSTSLDGGTSKCVWVCCETTGTTDCPTTDQCP